MLHIQKSKLVQGYVEMQQAANFPCHLTMFWPDEQAAEWFEVIAMDLLRAKFREGSLRVPGFDSSGWVGQTSRGGGGTV